MSQHDPGLDLYLRIRSGFVRQGTTFGAWCRERGINRSNARQAVVGSWNGPKARALRQRLIKAARIQEAG